MELIEIVLEEKVMANLLLSRITPCLKGYFYLKEGIKKIIKDPSLRFDIHRRLYRMLSHEFGEPQSLVERDIRHALDVAFKRKGIEMFEKISHMHFSECKPSPREYLIVLADAIRFNRGKPFLKGFEKKI